uniref:DNA methyltransferase 1-associated protein 1 n=1 Tax=Plectus sambesii TaxID=2011161 RepID=A0A914W8Z8_9BILA
MMMKADMQDLLDGGRNGGTSEPLDESNPLLMGSLTSEQKKKKPPKAKQDVPTFKRPEGMHRELYNLLVNDVKGKDVSPLVPTLVPSKLAGYRNPKAQIGLRKVRHWEWTSFENSARTDDLKLSHWQRIDRINEAQEYPFARFNKVISIPLYTNEEYEANLASQKWTRNETDHLFDLCKRFDLRWPVIVDRWDRTAFPLMRAMEDMKDRFYAICNALSTARDGHSDPLCFDADHERRRKEQLTKLWNRSKEEVEEEEMLVEEERKIEGRRRDRERKAQDLQKLITAADRAPFSPTVSASALSPGGLGLKKKAFRNKLGSTSTLLTATAALNAGEHSGLKFPEFRSQGAHLRSQEMKMPTNVGQKKLKAMETVFEKLNIEAMPIGSEEVARDFNELRSDAALLYDLKSALQGAEFELQSLRNRYQAITGKTFDIPPRIRVACTMEPSGVEGAPTSKRRLVEAIDLSLAALPTKKRKTALEQTSLMKRVRRQ